eukprot:TRINITY_DN708_c0_g2_i3.p1 TRINITY_DN708_c0_g2~~TRINITY_DN708_c0_g2_i3.p1  ORF type:complete len:679 (+),score=42.45 TRINITY_DN708_c0_g2_i3:207-2039(+)
MATRRRRSITDIAAPQYQDNNDGPTAARRRDNSLEVKVLSRVLAGLFVCVMVVALLYYFMPPWSNMTGYGLLILLMAVIPALLVYLVFVCAASPGTRRCCTTLFVLFWFWVVLLLLTVLTFESNSVYKEKGEPWGNWTDMVQSENFHGDSWATSRLWNQPYAHGSESWGKGTFAHPDIRTVREAQRVWREKPGLPADTRDYRLWAHAAAGWRGNVTNQGLIDLVKDHEDRNETTAARAIRITRGDFGAVEKAMLGEPGRAERAALRILALQLELGANISEAAYKALDMEESDVFGENPTGTYGVVIESKAHPRAAVIGYHLRAGTRCSASKPTPQTRPDLRICIAVRGSIDPTSFSSAALFDWLASNLVAWPAVSPKAGDPLRFSVLSAHPGYYDRYSRLVVAIKQSIEDVLNKLKRLEENGERSDIFPGRLLFRFSGHSQGGALATLLSLAFQHIYRTHDHAWPMKGKDRPQGPPDGLCGNSFHLWTYASPSPVHEFNLTGAAPDSVWPVDDRIRHLRFIAPEDWVPWITEKFSYADVGDTVVTKGAGRSATLTGRHSEYPTQVRNLVRDLKQVASRGQSHSSLVVWLCTHTNLPVRKSLGMLDSDCPE